MAATARQVVVVGGGMAGLVAALTAREAGADVLVLEAGAAPGGSAALSAGFITTFGSFEDYQRRIPLGEPVQGRLVQEQYDTAVTWLADLGMPLAATSGPDAAG